MPDEYEVFQNKHVTAIATQSQTCEKTDWRHVVRFEGGNTRL